MKKSILMLAALAAVFAACSKSDKSGADENFVATFEEAEISPEKLDSEFFLDSTGTFQSGNFIFKQTSMPGYHSCNVVSNHTDTTFVDWNDAWKSAAGGAYEGNNYVVWNLDYYGADTIKLVQPGKVPGFYVTNCIYSYSSMKYGDEIAGDPFATGDKFMLTITGVRNGEKTSSVDFYLAKADKILNEWTYVELNTLNEVDGLIFSLSGSRTGDYGLNTPAYFAFDNLGAKQ